MCDGGGVPAVDLEGNNRDFSRDRWLKGGSTKIRYKRPSLFLKNILKHKTFKRLCLFNLYFLFVASREGGSRVHRSTFY